MRPLSIVSNNSASASGLSKQLAGIFAVRLLAADDIWGQVPDGLIFVDIDLAKAARADRLRGWLEGRDRQATVIFAVDKRSHVQIVQAYSLGATDIVYRPVSSRGLTDKLINSPNPKARAKPARGAEASCGVVAGITALQQLFASATQGVPLDINTIAEAGATLVSHIEEFGFGDWVQAIRVHHDQTYQHCLLVSGACAAFALHLGFNPTDQRRVAMAGLLHDTGKVMIPLDILQAPRALDDEEMRIVRRHAEMGYTALLAAKGLHPEMLDMVKHHHEYLDGSGYPDGLCDGSISDLTRVVTIADIFGALIERRAYRPPMSGRAAYEVLLSMAGKLDRHLVRAFQPLSLVEFVPA